MAHGIDMTVYTLGYFNLIRIPNSYDSDANYGALRPLQRPLSSSLYQSTHKASVIGVHLCILNEA